MIGEKMTYEQLMNECKLAFNFAPCEEFNNISHLLETARKDLGSCHFYVLGAAIVAEKLALYLDQDIL
jgi:hypothetical protein